LIRFDFDRLTYIYSKTLFLWLLEAVIQKGLFYFLVIGDAAFCDLLAYTGYKFVVLCPIAIAELLVGYVGSYVVMTLFGALYVLFFF